MIVPGEAKVQLRHDLAGLQVFPVRVLPRIHANKLLETVSPEFISGSPAGAARTLQ